MALFAVLGCINGVAAQESMAQAVAAQEVIKAEQAFAAGDYATALRFYQRAQPTADVITQYNDAMCYFKLAKWAQAQATFAALQLQYPDLELVTYHLAVSQKNLGQFSLAIQNFTALSQSGASPVLVNAALQQLILLAPVKPVAPKTGVAATAPTHNVVMRVQMGRDSDARHSAFEQAGKDKGDNFSLVSAAGYLAGDVLTQGRWRASAFAQLQRFQQASDSDSREQGVAVEWGIEGEGRMADAYMGAVIGMENSDYGDQSGLTTDRFGLKWRWQHQWYDWALTADAYHIRSDDAVLNPLVGRQQRALLTYRQRFFRVCTSECYGLLAIGVEHNQRNDDLKRGEWISYSPSRQWLSAEWGWQGKRWALGLAGQYRLSDYPMPVGRLAERFVAREDQRIAMRLSIQRRWQRWLGELAFDYQRNQSHVAFYQYTQHFATMGLAYAF